MRLLHESLILCMQPQRVVSVFSVKYFVHSLNKRDWSLITGKGGGATKREGGHVKFYPYEKGGGAEKVLAMLKGDTKSCGVVFTLLILLVRAK